MPKIQYTDKKPRQKTLELINTANLIIEEYEIKGFKLTLRQLYYQFVARGLIDNTDRNYKNLGVAIDTGRKIGEIDWHAIEDRTRFLRGVTTWDDPRASIENASEEFLIDMWENQERRVEVWIEKDALVGVIENVCEKHQVDYFSCRGYTSQSAQWEAAQRLEKYSANGQSPIIIHLGDHDPSGIDMTRDIRDRFELFIEGGDFDVNRIALNMDQVRKYKPPPNPAKTTDSRSTGYIGKYGNKSWELDAIEPEDMAALVDKEIKKHVDPDLWAEKEEEWEEYINTFNRILDDLE